MSEIQKLALVTGGNSGIGLATVKKLLAHNCRMIVLDRRIDRIKKLGLEHGNIRPHQVDLSIPDQVDAFCGEISDLAEPVEILVNAAGYSMRGVLEEVSLAHIRRIFSVNVFGLIRIIQACLPAMRKNRRGTIVNITSIAGKFTFPGNGPYAATKHAVEAFSDALRHEIAPFGIRVVVIRPAFIATEFNAVAQKMSEKIALHAIPDYKPVVEKSTGGLCKMWKEVTPLSPDEVASLIVQTVFSEKPHAAYAIGPISEEFLRLRAELGDDEWTSFLDNKMGLDNLKL